MQDAGGDRERQGNKVPGVKHDGRGKGNGYGDNPLRKKCGRDSIGISVERKRRDCVHWPVEEVRDAAEDAKGIA